MQELEKRTVTIGFRLSPSEVKALDAMCRHQGRSRANTLRKLVNDAVRKDRIEMLAKQGQREPR